MDLIIDSEMKLKDWLEYWLENYVRPTANPWYNQHAVRLMSLCRCLSHLTGA